MRDEAGRQRVVIEGIAPEIDGGRFPIKRVVGEKVVVEADVFTDGHDAISCRLLFKPQRAAQWSEGSMAALPNDRWRAEFTVTEQGRWKYAVTGWVDHFKSWRRDLKKRVEAGQDVALDLRIGAGLIRAASRRAEDGQKKTEARILTALAKDLEEGADPEARLRLALDDELCLLMDRHADRRFATTSHELEIVVDREKALFSSWYEMFPRSAGPAGHATVKDAEARLPSVAKMGFDVLCLPPLHPTGELEDFRRFRDKAAELRLEIALDLAFQGSPDFESAAWRELWQELKGVVDHWIAQGVHIFRVDDPHAQPFPFWEWLIGEVKSEHPHVLFLAAAFTRPKVMLRLAKLGFTQSSNGFPWRNTRRELIESFTELTQTELKEFFRAHLWPNTPDILTEPLQSGGRPAFVQRLVLAATLGASYGIYGPAFEPMESTLRELIALVNKIRRENPALQAGRGLRFHPADNEQILCYSKVDDKGDNTILVAVNLDPHHVQSAWVDLPVDDLGLPRDQPYQVHDLLTGARYLWHGSRNFVQLDPQSIPAHVFRVRRRMRSERDFDSFL